MHFRLRKQLDEAFGPVNRWYCAQAYGRPVDDREVLLIYFIRSGGARDFASRYEQAMGPLNRWYCSEFYGRDIREPETLWNYYAKTCASGSHGGDPRGGRLINRPALSIAG